MFAHKHSHAVHTRSPKLLNGKKICTSFRSPDFPNIIKHITSYTELIPHRDPFIAGTANMYVGKINLVCTNATETSRITMSMSRRATDVCHSHVFLQILAVTSSAHKIRFWWKWKRQWTWLRRIKCYCFVRFIGFTVNRNGSPSPPSMNTFKQMAKQKVKENRHFHGNERRVSEGEIRFL